MAAPTARNEGVAARHPSYVEIADFWQTCRDLALGERHIHAAGDRYLPRLVEQESPDYDAYVARARLFNAFWRTIEGLRGLVFRKAPRVDGLPPALEPLLDDITASGVPFTTLARTTVEETLEVGRIFLLADMPEPPEGAVTVADVLDLNMRPRALMYRAEALIDWHLAEVDNRVQLVQVRLMEEREIDGKDEWTRGFETIYRVLDLVRLPPETKDGPERTAYRVRIFRKDEKGNDVQEGPDVYPRLGGQVLPEIPGIVIGPDSLTPEIDDPPLADLVTLNLHHYRRAADLSQGLHFAALPTPWVAGHKWRKDPTTGKVLDTLQVGTTTALPLDQGATCGYMEVAGPGFAAVRQDLEDMKQEMAILGARMLEAPKRAVEPVGTVLQQAKGEESALASMVGNVSIGLTIIMRWLVAWAGYPDAAGGVFVKLNKQFFPRPIDSGMLTSLTAAQQAGGISYLTYFENLQDGGIIPEERTVDEEQDAVTEEQAERMAQQLAIFEGQTAIATAGATDDEAEPAAGE
jgi:hypothetical protein